MLLSLLAFSLTVTSPLTATRRPQAAAEFHERHARKLWLADDESLRCAAIEQAGAAECVGGRAHTDGRRRDRGLHRVALVGALRPRTLFGSAPLL